MLPNRNLTLPAEGRRQRESLSDDLVLTGVGWSEPMPNGLAEAMGLAQWTQFKEISARQTLYRSACARC